MNRIDRLFKRTMKLGKHNDVLIINNQACRWMVGGQAFPDLEAAEQAAGEMTGEESDICVIINDLGPGESKKDVAGNGRHKAKDRDADRDKKNTFKGDKHDREREHGRKDSQYNHTWV